MSRLSKEAFDCVASTSQEDQEEAVPRLSSTRTLQVTLLSSEWRSTKGGMSTINRELAIQLAKQPDVQVTVYLPECSEEEKQDAAIHNVQLIQAEQIPGYDDPVDWLATLPKGHVVDCVIGQGVHLGKLVQLIQRRHHCKWIQVVHDDPEELAMFKSNADAISKGEKQRETAVELCRLSDQVVAVGPKITNTFSGYLRPFGKDQNVFNLTPGILSEFAGVKQASEERITFSVLLVGSGNSEDLQLKGYDIAAKAIAELKDISKHYKLKFVGVPSEQEQKVAEMFIQEGIDRSQLVVRGFKEREQLAAQFCEVDLAIMPSRSEGFGLAALEAFSAGLPLLVSGNSGLGEALRNVLCGSICVVDSEDPKDWAKAISSVCNKGRDFRLGEAKLICEQYAKTYSWEEQCRLLVKRMRHLASGFPGGTTPSSVMENSQASFPTVSEANLRSGTEGPSRGRVSSSVQSTHLALPAGDSQPYQRHFGGGFSQRGTNQAENKKRLLPSVERQPLKRTRQVVVEDQVEGFSGGGQSTVTPRSMFHYPESSHNQLQSSPEGKHLLAQGELAWAWLLEGRRSSCEEHLARFDGKDKELLARRLSLVSKEARLQKINPQHEQHSTHKVFQEHLAATYLKDHLLKMKGNVLRDFKLDFRDVVLKYRQVFLFLSGLLGEEAVILFRQIGEQLRLEKWDWFHCKEAEARFFVESFSDSGIAEQIAMALCSVVPFPSILEVDTKSSSFLLVAEYCKTFLQIPQPVHVIMSSFKKDNNLVNNNGFDYVASSPRLQTLSLSLSPHFRAQVEEYGNGLFSALSANSSLQSFTLKPFRSISSSVANVAGNALAASKSLTTMTFELWDECGEAWASALETGLSADTPLNSVVLKISGSMSAMAILALKRVLVHNFLTSLGIIIHGGIYDSLATVIAEGLAIQTVLKEFSLTVYGRISELGVRSLERGFLQNGSLLNSEVNVFGKIPDSWTTVIKSIISVYKPNRSCSFHPDIRGSIATAKLVCHNPIVTQTSLNRETSINLWGELSWDGSQAPAELLVGSASSKITFNFHGDISDNFASSLSSYLMLPHKTLSLVTFNIWEELSSDRRIALDGLQSDSRISCHFHMMGHDLMPNCCPDWIDFFVDNPLLLPPVFTKLKDCGTNKLALTVSGMSKDWAHGLGDSLKNSTSLTALALTINNYTDDSGCHLHCLAKSTSLTTLILTVNYSTKVHKKNGAQLPVLRDVLAKNKNLSTLSLMINNYGTDGGEWIQSLTEGLVDNNSLKKLSLTIHRDEAWMGSLDDILAINPSLTSLTLNVKRLSEDWVKGLCDGLVNHESLTSLVLTLDDYSATSAVILLDGLKGNTSLNTVSLTFNGCHNFYLPSVSDSLLPNLSLRSLAITFSDYDLYNSDYYSILKLGEILAKFQSLDTLSITLTNHVMDTKWLLALANCSAKCTSLKTLSLMWNNYINTTQSCDEEEEEEEEKVDGNMSLTEFTLIINKYGVESENCMAHLSEVLAKHTSVSVFSLTFNNHSVLTGDWMQGVRDGLVKSTSLASFSLTVNNYGDMSVDWTWGLAKAVAKSKSLTCLSVAINSCSEICEHQLFLLCNKLAKSDTLTTLSLTVNDHSDASKGVGLDLGKCFAHCKSLKSLSLTVNLYGKSSDF